MIVFHHRGRALGDLVECALDRLEAAQIADVPDVIADAVVLGLHAVQSVEHDPLNLGCTGDQVLCLDRLHRGERSRADAWRSRLDPTTNWAVATTAARRLRPDAVYIVTPWSETATIDECIDEFLNIPVEIHLGPERILDRFENVRIAAQSRRHAGLQRVADLRVRLLVRNCATSLKRRNLLALT